MSISEQVKELEDVADLYMNNDRYLLNILLQAADAIEELSAKLQVANMKQSEAHYNGRWIECENRLPEENQLVLASFSHGAVTILTYYDKKFHGIYDYTINTILAWQPLPEPYHIMKTKNNSSNRN